MNPNDVWSRIFGQRIESFTHKGKYYTVSYGLSGWECTCKDFEFRHGSYTIEVTLEHSDPMTLTFQACKHVEKLLQDKCDEGKSDIKRVCTRKNGD